MREVLLTDVPRDVCERIGGRPDTQYTESGEERPVCTVRIKREWRIIPVQMDVKLDEWSKEMKYDLYDEKDRWITGGSIPLIESGIEHSGEFKRLLDILNE